MLDGLSFDIYDQDFVSIIGPSGCGKSTIFNFIAGLIEPDDGSILYERERVANLRGRVGYMMQKDLLFPWRTVLENVLLGLESKGITEAAARDSAREHLNTYGLGGFENSYPRTLSGGMRQRAALIRTLITDPGNPAARRAVLRARLSDAALSRRRSRRGGGKFPQDRGARHARHRRSSRAFAARGSAISGRPSRVKSVHGIEIAERTPAGARSDPRFSDYFHTLCGELDIQTQAGAA